MMRKLLLLMATVTPMLGGCAGSVIFGHVIGQDHPNQPVQPAAQESAPSVAAPGTASTASASPAVATPAAVQQQTPPRAPESRLKVAALTFTSDATDKINADSRFNRDALLTSINTQLRSHDLIDDSGGNQAQRSIEFTIDDFAVRAASNAVVFGYVFNNATLVGQARVHDAAGHEVEHFEIRAETRVTTRTDGDPAQALNSLYRRFADITVGKLTGVPFKAPETEMPR